MVCMDGKVSAHESGTKGIGIAIIKGHIQKILL